MISCPENFDFPHVFLFSFHRSCRYKGLAGEKPRATGDIKIKIKRSNAAESVTPPTPTQCPHASTPIQCPHASTPIQCPHAHPVPPRLHAHPEDGGGSSEAVAGGGEERQAEKNVKVHFNSSFNVVKYGDGTDIKDLSSQSVNPVCKTSWSRWDTT
ncbi:uncharacterized protein LOC127003696 [Eriocheir sinensis]|uniref:uncharacterized protein LOC127003696 n=1 Tax=Eriocheir sinensis TaxID=95602 RepID=UPI0021C753DA|nr:uncharacterized protein LOC127003696 [Eriocheir sinensis]